MNYAIIGSGKLARHLSHLFNLNAISTTIFNRKSNFDQLNYFDYIFLAISDDEIKNFYDGFKYLHHKKWFHFSGAHYFEDIIGIHPMMSFSDELYDLDFYQKIHWVIDHDLSVKDILPISEQQISTIKKEDKAHYHALCVLAGNIPHLIWQSLEKDFLNFNISKKDLLNYVFVTTQNYLNNRAATGPIVRNDQKTINENLNNLAKPYQQIYLGAMEIQNENNSRF